MLVPTEIKCSENAVSLVQSPQRKMIYWGEPQFWGVILPFLSENRGVSLFPVFAPDFFFRVRDRSKKNERICQMNQKKGRSFRNIFQVKRVNRNFKDTFSYPLGAKKASKKFCLHEKHFLFMALANIFWASIMSWFKRTQQSIQNTHAWAAQRPLFRCQSLRFVQPFRVCESSEYKEPGLENWRKSERGLDCFEIANIVAAPNINGTKFNSLVVQTSEEKNGA